MEEIGIDETSSQTINKNTDMQGITGRIGSDYDIPNENIQIEVIDVPNWAETVESHQNPVHLDNSLQDINSIKENNEVREGGNDINDVCLC